MARSPSFLYPSKRVSAFHSLKSAMFPTRELELKLPKRRMTNDPIILFDYT
jgi:hypothetical protein